MSQIIKHKLKRGAATVGIVISVGLAIAGYLVLGNNRAQDKADAAVNVAETRGAEAIKTASEAKLQTAELKGKVEAIEKKVDELKTDTKKDLDNINNKLNLLLSR